MADIRSLEQTLAVDREEAVSVIEHAVRLGLPVPMEYLLVAAAAQVALDQIELDCVMGRRGLTPEFLRRWEDYMLQQRRQGEVLRRRAAMSQAVWSTAGDILAED